MELSKTLLDIINSLKSISPAKIVLFGSYVSGNVTTNSDIDLCIILDDNLVSKSYEERMNKKLTVRKLIREINYLYPIDLFVYSKAEYKLLKLEESDFINEIESTGKVIYEKAS